MTKKHEKKSNILILKKSQNSNVILCKITQHTKGGETLVNVGEKIKTARIAKGLTQEQLGELLGLQKSAVAKYENGRVVNIKRSTLQKISEVLGIRPAELITDNTKMTVSENRQKLIELINSIPESKVEITLKMINSIIEND